MKRSPVTVGGQSLINHREGKFYMGKTMFHNFHAISKIYLLSIKGLGHAYIPFEHILELTKL